MLKKLTLVVTLLMATTASYATAPASAGVAQPSPSVNSKITVSIDPAADCSPSTPCYVIKTSAIQLSQAINQNITDKQAFNMVQNSILPQFDFSLMTRLAMGANWKKASEAQQNQIVDLFKQQLLYSYSLALSKFKGAQVAIINSSISGEKQNKAIVTSTIALPSNGNSNNQPVNIEYDLAKISNSWKIYDVKIEYASIVTTYRTQFNDVVQNSGIAGLIGQLQAKVNNLKNNK